jgi:hypothetical protein
MIVILSYFHTRIGTCVYDSFPKANLDKEKILERIPDIMTRQNQEEFFTQSFENIALLNYYFEIWSEWARGKREMLMITLLFNQQISPEIEKSIAAVCKESIEIMQSNEEIYPGFYIKDIATREDDEKELILENEKVIKDWIVDLYWKIFDETRKKTEEEKITLLLNDRYIFESLEKMSTELGKIDTSIMDCKECPHKSSDVIKNSTTRLHTLIDGLYEAFMEKMASIDIEGEEELFSPEDDMDIDIEDRKKQLLQVLEDEINGIKVIDEDDTKDGDEEIDG